MMKYEEVKLYDQVVKASEVYFRYLLSGDDDMSRNFRHFIIKELYGITVEDTTILSKGIVPKAYALYEPLLDVLMQDETRRIFDMELLLFTAPYEELDSIHAYSLYLMNRMLADTSSPMRTCYQIIFVNHLHFHMTSLITQECIMDKGVPGGIVYTTIITLPYLKDIIKEKGIENLHEFEKVCYVLTEGFNSEAAAMDSEMVRIMFEKHEEMISEREWWEWAAAAERAKLRRSHKECEDIRRGKIMLMDELILHKFGVDAHTWIVHLNEDELQNLTALYCQCSSFTELQNCTQNA